ncbi:hypothetical protein AaE_014964 [Aphanomyces astaci]|uniref:Retrotransposon gag domain-containing protein n=2 Tax=Aphanomyces astaci TaxID=112090 RepID=A0A6A4Z397_APHAT|nr:hypothetical protein AaE_014964 [Aphanomyces astaci]
MSSTVMTANGRTLQDSLRLAQDENARLASALESSDNSSAPRLKPIKLEAAKFSGAESDKLLRWLLHVKTASDALGISDQATRVALAMSYLKGCAEDWAFSKRLTDFPSFAAFKNELKAMFLRLNSDFRYRSQYLACKQGKRSLQEFILDYLADNVLMRNHSPNPCV